MELKMIELKDIVTNPLQPRQTFDREKLQELANSIKEGELLQPIVVRKKGTKFEIVAGERRFKSFQILEEPRIPAIVREIKDDTDALEKSLIENWQRDDLTSAEKEKALRSLWESKQYDSYETIAKKLGLACQTIKYILGIEKDRRELNISDKISTRTLSDTMGLSDEPRKKILKQIEEKKISTDNVRDVVRKVKEFPEPEQQMEILKEFEEQEEQSKEIFDSVIDKYRQIAQGEREPEQIIEIEKDNDKRMIQDYYDIKNRVLEIYSDHINHFKNEESKQEAIRIIQDIINYLNKQLIDLGVNVVIEHEKKET